ncbi:MAG: hypothetical protein ABIN58_10920, partial [candidate division WOR-3 bacterium]
MMTGDEITARLNLPAATQIGVIVRDMEKAVDYYSKVGIGPFTPINDLRPDKAWYMGELHPALRTRYDLPEAAVQAADLDLDGMIQLIPARH